MAQQTENTQTQTFTQADIDNITAKHQEEMTALDMRLREEYKRKADGDIKALKAKMADEAKRANMSELEKANAELEDLRVQLQESQDAIALTNQKDETRKFMTQTGVEEKCLDFVFVPKDMEATRARTKAFKAYIDEVKKTTFENNVQSKIPGAGAVLTGSNADMNNAIRAMAKN